MNNRPPMQDKHYLNKQGEFVIENYHLAKPFSSFFPGIAGVWGIPIWVFYANRGQAVVSFGIKDKDHPIMEFQPANKAYQSASLLGFRTFIKVHSKDKRILYDAFHNGFSALGFDIRNKMVITPYGLRLNEINHTLGLEVDIEYFTIPNDNYGALARIVSIRNISKQKKELEVLDGLPQIIPYGLNNMFIKKLSRTIEAWMGVENLQNKAPYLRLKVDPTDRPEVTRIKEGNFYLTFGDKGLTKPIVDPEAIFGPISDLTYPKVFLEKKNFSYPKDQLTKSRTPCCMGYYMAGLKPQEGLMIYSLAGNMDSLDKLNQSISRIADKEYLNRKKGENKEIIDDLQSRIFMHSSSFRLSLYCKQTFLDNCLRGGLPLFFGSPDNPVHIQLYSRKHGDLERDYNKFLIEPTYFSQGNGNFRDANQNRRLDVCFEPRIKERAIKTFFNLIQTDGYNPLVIKPDTFKFNAGYAIFDEFLKPEEKDKLMDFLNMEFSPGELAVFLENNIGLSLSSKKDKLLNVILTNSICISNAEHSEGFWSDHWAYCLDLLQAYLSIYPENLKHLLLEDKEFTFFDNTEYVRPRKEKYFLRGKQVFQYHAVTNSPGKHALIKKRGELAHIMRAENGCGEIYKTSLCVKMLVVIANKFATLDPFGVGVEMEADKPNWYDSLNGLPGLLGSSSCEAFELKRWIVFLRESFKTISLEDGYIFNLPVELYDFLLGLKGILNGSPQDFKFWDGSHTLKEKYRHDTLMGFKGEEKPLGLAELYSALDAFLAKIESGLEKAYSSEYKLHYSYFINEVVEYEIISNAEYMPLVMPLKFKQKPLPLFLEGIMHYLRVIRDKKEAGKVFEAVRKSPLFDKKLKMYKVNAPLLEMPEEIGRCRVFTPGWLENESIWLHMEYKYMLELLKNGLYKEFYGDFKNVLIPFQDPKRYGRSVLENSSFLVSSAFPQSKMHGSGFVARLSGSTIEFLNIWLVICQGHVPFYLDENKKLCLKLEPILPAWLFTKGQENGFPKDTFAFKMLNKTLVVYHNPKKKDTFGPDKVGPREILLEYFDQSVLKVSLKSPQIGHPLSYDVREGKISRIDVFLS